MRLDLHVHSLYSDGLRSPAWLCERARKMELVALALTDHDTLDGLPAFFSSAEGFTPIGGVELSCGASGDLHILGYGLRGGDEPLETALKQARRLRRERGERMIEALHYLGYDVPRDGLPTGDAPFGRPHIARALVKMGACSTVKQAFDRLLGDGKPAYVPYEHMTAADAVGFIRESGGVPVLAHPYRSHLSGQTLKLLLDELQRRGLLGLEVYHSSVSRKHARELDVLARGMGLLVTGGSDDHQERASTVRLGYPGAGWTSVREDCKALLSAIAHCNASIPEA